ncbi:MAG TPA: tyrosine-type recombinase/integrase [Candidatus Saccharimonadia bacterium]|nr:tyrosine-type recombinase/integrase [Candidatus Saccharimonadia bacterium]
MVRKMQRTPWHSMTHNAGDHGVFWLECSCCTGRAWSRFRPLLQTVRSICKTRNQLFETNRATCYSPRRIQYIVKETAEQAQITKRVYPHLLRHSVATTLLERGMPIEQIQKFLGHSKLETTQLYAESSTQMMRESYQRALSR